MKYSFTSQEIKSTFCTVSGSLLLCSSLEAQASPVFEENPLWYDQGATPLTLPALATPLPNRSPGHPDLRSSRLTVEDAAPLAWDDVYGQASRHAQNHFEDRESANSATEAFKGPAILTLHSGSGHVQRLGLVSGLYQIQGNRDGALIHRAQANPDIDALAVQGQSLGAYWSLTGPQGWHVDLTASGGRVKGFSRNERGSRQAAEGSAVTFSVEGGFPIGLSDHWVVEPQAQLINQRVTLDTPNASSASDGSNELTSWSGRVGARLKGNYEVNGLPVEPYVRTNLWHTVYTGNTVTLDQVDKISSSRKSSTVEVGLGLVAKVTPLVSLYVSADYSSDVDDNDLNGLIGSLGVRMRW